MAKTLVGRELREPGEDGESVKAVEDGEILVYGGRGSRTGDGFCYDQVNPVGVEYM